jgi:hypothetical protein
MATDPVERDLYRYLREQEDSELREQEVEELADERMGDLSGVQMLVEDFPLSRRIAELIVEAHNANKGDTAQAMALLGRTLYEEVYLLAYEDAEERVDAGPDVDPPEPYDDDYEGCP